MDFEKMGDTSSPEEERESRSWVQDILSEEAEELVMKMQVRNEGKQPKESKYEIGPSRSGKENEVGIYFFDPTAKKEKE